MTEKLKQTIHIPNWVVILLVPIIISLFTVTFSIGGRISKIEEKTIKTEQLIDSKANQTDVDRLYKTLDRIENKIDNLKK